MRRTTSTHLVRIVCTAGLLLLGPARLGYGQLLNIQFNPNGPVFLAANGSLNYDVATGEFSGTGVPLTYSSSTLPGGGFVTFSGNPQFSFDLFVNPDGTFRSNGAGFDLSGTLNVGGTAISGTLLSGDFTAFGSEPAGPPTWVSNALFDATGGALTAPIPLADGSTLPTQFSIGGSLVGIDFFAENVTSGTLGDFHQSFGSDDLKSMGGATIPEPASGVLAMIAVAVLCCFGLVKK
jgi:hypothetical protein